MAKEANIPQPQMLAATLTVLLLAAKPPPVDPIKTCSVYGPLFGLERLIMCPKFRVEVYPPMPLASEKAVITEQAKTAAAPDEGREVLAMTEVKFAGQKRVAIRYLRKRGDGNSDVGLVSTLPGPPGTYRLVHCWNAIEAGCFDVFSRLMKGMPDSIGGTISGPPQYQGRTLALPQGCTRKAVAHVSCPQADLSWASMFDGAPESIGQVEPLVKRSFSQAGTFEAKDRYCEIEGNDALCRLATVTAKNGSKTWLLYGFGSVRGQRVWTLCAMRKEPKDAIPAPCSEVLAFKKQ